MLASPTLTHSTAPLFEDAHRSDDGVDPWADIPPADFVLQHRGADRGRLTRLDSLGLVVRVKRPDESARPR